MRIFLAGPSCLYIQGDFLRNISLEHKPYILESFYYITPFITENIKYFGGFLLDSGAYTFMQNPKKMNYKEYADSLIKYVNKNNIENFFELDIDYLIGYPEVKKLRRYIESETKKQSIPVFHKVRGIKEWEAMCEEYNYVAIGTIGEYKKNPEILRYMLKIARKTNTKVHGLGFTVKNLQQFDFYSVDSTSWLTGQKFGYLYKFNGEVLEKFNRKAGQRLADYKAVTRNNFTEWVKYQKYMDNEFTYRGYHV